MSEFQAYPQATHVISVTKWYAGGQVESFILGPHPEADAISYLAVIAQEGIVAVPVAKSTVVRVSETELIVTHNGNFSTWTARLVVGRVVPRLP